MSSNRMPSETFLKQELENVSQENKQLKRRIETLYHENMQLKRALYDLNIRFNQVQSILKQSKKSQHVHPQQLPSLFFDIDALQAEQRNILQQISNNNNTPVQYAPHQHDMESSPAVPKSQQANNAQLDTSALHQASPQPTSVAEPFLLKDEDKGSVTPISRKGSYSQIHDQISISKDYKFKFDLQGHKGAIYNVQFSPCGTLLASCSYDKTVRVWDMQKQQQVTLRDHQSSILDIAWSADSSMLLSGSVDKTMKMWDVATSQLAKSFGADGFVQCVTFHPSTYHILCV